MEDNTRFENEFSEINKLYDECISYLKDVKVSNKLKLNLLEEYENEVMEEENVNEVSDSEENADDYLENYIENKNENNNKRNSFKRSESFTYQKSKTELKFENEIEVKNFSNEKENLLEAVNHIKTDKINFKLNQKGEKIKINPKIVPKLEDNSKKCNQNDTKKQLKLELLKPDQNNIKLTHNDEESLITEKENKTIYSRLRRLSQQLPKIIITKSNSSLNSDQTESFMKSDRYYRKLPTYTNKIYTSKIVDKRPRKSVDIIRNPIHRLKAGYGDYPRRLVSKNGIENVALISNVPYERLRLLNDTFHTLINLRWRWIVSGTIVVHFLIWLVFAVFWYITALAHYDFEPDPPKRTCVTGGKDFVTIFLASVEAQTTIGFGDRTIDEECPESIFLFIMQLILGTGLSGVLTCVVYAKLTRPEKLSRDGVGFSKKAVISIRDGQLCLMIRAWDLNYDHIISSDFSAHFIKTHRTKEGEVIRYYARTLDLQQKQFLIWPVTLVHVIDETSPLYYMTPQNFAEFSYEITVSLKGASASMGTFTQSQTSYLPKEIIWGHKFPAVVKYDRRKQKYAIEHKKLDVIEAVDTPLCSASQLYFPGQGKATPPSRPCTPGSFSEKMESFHLERQSSFRKSK